MTGRFEDRYGMPLTTASEPAVAALDGAQHALLSATGDPVAAADAALAHDPGLVVAHCARARGLQLASQFSAARDVALHAVELAQRALPWEQAHAAITLDLMSGQVDAAFARLQPHMAEFPRDVVSAAAAAGVFGLIGFSGRRGREPEQLAYLEQLRPHYGDPAGRDWWFATAYAFALAENDRAPEAWRWIEQARATQPGSAHVAHTWMHVAIENGDDRRQREWLAGWLADYGRAEVLHCHLWWHHALLALAEGDQAAVAAMLREHCLPGQSGSPPINVFTDSVALLWRAGLAGAPHDPATWSEVMAYGEQWFARPGIFVDVHRALGLAATGQLARLDEYIAQLRELDAAGKVRAGAVVAEIASASGAYVRGDWSACVRQLDACAADVVRMGGSRAQRRIVSLTREAAARRV